MRKFYKSPNYPVVLYPEAIYNFCRYYPLIRFHTTIGTTDKLPAGNFKIYQNRKTSNRLKDPINLIELKPKLKTLQKLIGWLWICWIVGVVAVMVFGVIGNLPGLATVLFIGAYCCLMLVLYGWVNSVKVNLLKRWQFQQKSSELSNSTVVKEPLILMTTKSQESIEQHFEGRKEKLRQILQDKVQPIGASQARQGVSEREFGRYLQVYFGKVIQGAEFQVFWQNKRRFFRAKVKRKLNSSNNYNYSADFLVIHSLTGLGLDVEVDEPYTLLTKEPTHCVDRSQDCWRNQFFLESGWVVVRFSERQVVEAPRSCCKVIAQVIFEITGDRNYLQQLEGEPELLPERPWTVREARRKARNNYRLQYLPQSVRESMQSTGRRRGARK